MDLLSALEALKLSGSLALLWEGRHYRLLVREGFVRMVVDETKGYHPLEREEALALLRDLARFIKEVGKGPEVDPSPVEVPIHPPSKGILVSGEDLLGLA